MSKDKTNDQVAKIVRDAQISAGIYAAKLETAASARRWAEAAQLIEEVEEELTDIQGQPLIMLGATLETGDGGFVIRKGPHSFIVAANNNGTVSLNGRDVRPPELFFTYGFYQTVFTAIARWADGIEDEELN